MNPKFEKKSDRNKNFQNRSRNSQKNSSKNLAGVMVDSVGLRIIGGTFRGRRLEYAGDMRVRPMKDRVRESVFNLVGTGIKGKFALDLFGGTGAVCLEAISRGAVRGQIIEMHFPTAKTIQNNIHTLQIEDKVQLHTGNVFIWNKKRQPLPQDVPWVVFMCPPYEFFISRWSELEELFDSLYNEAPMGSMFVVESDERFDWELLTEKSCELRVASCEKPEESLSPIPNPQSPVPSPKSPIPNPQSPVPSPQSSVPAQWDIRVYPPAVVGLLKKE